MYVNPLSNETISLLYYIVLEIPFLIDSDT